MTVTLQCRNLSVTAGQRQLVEDLNLDLPAGSITALLGLNGSGKTLTLHTLAGIRKPASGEVLIRNTLIEELDRRQVAQQLGLLLQIHEDAFPMTVKEMVLMSCYARLGMWQWESADDVASAELALAEFDLNDLGDRIVTSLSGGERRRVALAGMRIQNPDIWLLDEPANHLDPHHQVSLMDKLLTLKNENKTILASMHDPLLAARYADHALLLNNDGSWEFGDAALLLTPERLLNLYGLPYEYLSGSKQSALVPT